jgi:hypothetical protein
MQIFVIGMGRGLKELYSQYIYMIPESSFKKIIWSNMETVFKVAVESVLTFGITGAIMGEPPIFIVEIIVVYTLFSLLLIGINYLFMRLTGADLSAGILILIYVVAVVVIMLPGVAAALIAGNVIDGVGVLIGLIILAAWELLAAVVCFALSKGILDKCDMPVVKTGN